MKKRHILGYFDNLVRTPAFLFLCAVFLCGAIAGGLTGLHASEGDRALCLNNILALLPENVLKSVLCSLVWAVLPLACAMLPVPALMLSLLCAAKGFVIALTVSISLGNENGFLLSLCAGGLPALISVPALIASAAIAWPVASENKTVLSKSSRLPFLICVFLAAVSALIRAALVQLGS